MHFKEVILDLVKDKDIDLFIDMDGVIASFDFGHPLEFDKKRPLMSNINILKEVSKIAGVNMYILSVCRKDNQVLEKNIWLDKYASFFKNENRFILSKETYTDISTANLKLKFLSSFETNNKMVLVDDDIIVLRTINDKLNNVILFQDSELID